MGQEEAAMSPKVNEIFGFVAGRARAPTGRPFSPSPR